jgi:hypothetical protein
VQRSRSRNRYGGKTRYEFLRDAAEAAALANGASLWYAGREQDLSGFVFEDSAGTTPATGTDPIGQLKDRTGAFNATAANKPTLELQANGYYGMRFDGSNDALSVALISAGVNSHTVIGAGNCNSAILDKIMFAQRGATTTPIVAQLEWTGNQPRYVVRDNAGTLVANTSATAALNVPIVASGSSGDGFRTLRVNGQIAAQTVLSALGATTVTANSIGQNATALTSSMSGLIYLICVSPTFMVDADRIAIERFAALLSGAAYV